MNGGMRGKYEVVRLLRSAILNGLRAFGEQVAGDPNVADGWQCLESDQPSLKDISHSVLLKQKNVTRIGWQNHDYVNSTGTANVDRKEHWMEQQDWEIRVIDSRKTAPVTAETKTVNDIVRMLVAWFNGGPGLEFLRSQHAGCLLVQQKDIDLYKDKSDVSQYTATFILKLHVPNTFTFTSPSASVVYKGTIPV